MFKPILVPLDGSTLDDRALARAAVLARRAGVSLHLARAVPAVSPMHYSGAETLSLAVAQQNDARLDAQASLALTASRMRRLGLVVHTHVRFGRASDVILETSREEGVGLIVLGTRARRGLARWWEGSVADEVVRWAGVPVLVLRAWDKADWSRNGPPRLMIALDGSRFAEGVLEPATELANVLGADVLLARAVTPPSLLPEAHAGSQLQEELAAAQAYLDHIASTLPIAGQVTTRIRVCANGKPDGILEQIARDEGVDLVALATRGRGGLARLAVGSTATAMLDRSPVPVLVVRGGRRETGAQSETFNRGALASTASSNWAHLSTDRPAWSAPRASPACPSITLMAVLDQRV